MRPIDVMNKTVLEEHGNPLTENSKWTDAGLDSFGTTMVFCDLDNEYGCFDKDWLNSVEWETLTVKDLLDRIANESTKL